MKLSILIGAIAISLLGMIGCTLTVMNPPLKTGTEDLMELSADNIDLTAFDYPELSESENDITDLSQAPDR